jgi:hypothetical protein
VTPGASASSGPAGERERGLARLGPLDPHVVEPERAEPDPERLHHGFACRETRGERRHGVGLGRDVGEFDLGEQPGPHRRRPFERAPEPFDVDQVDAADHRSSRHRRQ